MAATSILRRILTKVIDEEAEDSVSLELFNDWSMTLKLRKVFLKPEVVNGLTDIISFNSLYISDLSFDGAYNLSKHYCKIGLCLVEVDLHQDAAAHTKDEDLSASIQEFRDKMPISKETTLQDWLLNCVELVKVNVSRLTVIVRVSKDLPRITVEIHDFNFLMKHEANAMFSGKIGEIKVFHGEGLTKIRICEASNISFTKTNETLSLDFPDSFGYIDEVTANALSEVLTYVLNLLPSEDNNQNKEKSKQIVTVNLKKVQVGAGDFFFNLAKMNVSVIDNNVDITLNEIDSPLVQMNAESPLMIGIKLPTKEDLAFSESCSISNLIDWEREVFSKNLMKIKIILPELEVNLPISRYESLLKTCMLFPKIAPKTGSDSAKKTPTAVSIIILKLKATIDNIVLFTQKTSLGVFVNLTEDTELQIDVSTTNVYATLFDSMLVQSIPDNSAAACIVKLGANPSVDVNASHFAFGVPRKEGVNELMNFINTVTPKNENESNSNETNPMEIAINASDIFADYMTFAMPARVITQILDAKVNLKIENNEIKGDGTCGFSVFLSNLRQHIPIRALTGRDRILRLGFAETVKGIANDVSFSFKKPDVFHMDINHITAAGGLCSDSLDLLMSLYSHIRFGLEYGDPVISEPREKLKPEEVKEKLSESMMQSFMEPVPDMQSTPPVISEIEEEDNNSASLESSSEIQIEGPKSTPNVSINIKDANVSLLLYGGSDFEKIFDLRNLKKAPDFTQDEDVHDDFEYVLSRDELASLEVNSVLSLSVSLFKDDPSINMRLCSSISILDVIDRIPDSNARLMFGIEKRDASISLLFDILNDDALRLNVELPDIGMFITQQQVDFLINMFSRSIPVFQADTISVPTRFDFFGLRGNHLLINAHFTLFLSVSLEDVLIQLPICALSSVASIDDLVGRLSEFYFNELLWSAFSVAGGLPVINNLRRIGRAVCDLFTNFGWNSLNILLRTIATEALNATTCAASLTESLLKYATDAAAGGEDWRRSPIASLIVTHNIGALPNVILVPGRKAVEGATKMLRYVKDKINPNKRIDRKRMKI